MYAAGETAAKALGVEYTGDDVESVDMLIGVASDMIDQYCNRTFVGMSEETVEFNHDGTLILDLGKYILAPGATVSYVDPSGTATELVEGTDYQLWPQHPMLVDKNKEARHTQIRFLKKYSAGANCIRILGDWGFAYIPSSLEQVCIITIKAAIEAMNQPNDNVIRDSGLGRMRDYDSKKMTTAIPAFARMILDRSYRKRLIGSTSGIGNDATSYGGETID